MAPVHCQARTDSGLSPVFDGMLKRSSLPSYLVCPCVSVYNVIQPTSQCSKIVYFYIELGIVPFLKCKTFHECNWSALL